jgi:hypothetical protein
VAEERSKSAMNKETQSKADPASQLRAPSKAESKANDARSKSKKSEKSQKSKNSEKTIKSRNAS